MRALAVAAALLFGLTAARAGDGSAVRAIGFSPDGRYFAYEQYGERSGDGKLYSEIVTVDVRDDRHEEAPITETWTPETEDRKRKGEQLTLAQVREKASAKAGPTLKRLGIATPGLLAGAIAESRSGDMLGQVQVGPVREAATAAMALSAPPSLAGPSLAGPSLAGPGLAGPGLAGRLMLRPVPIDMRRCANLVAEGKPQGIVLTLEREGRTPHTLAHDRNIPASRGCPDRYGLAAAYTAPRADGSTALAIFIQYFYLAFEGPDRRFFAVTSAVR